MPDECKYHDCPKCGQRMTDRQCLTCTWPNGKPIRVRFCADCDGGPIIFQGKNDKEELENI